jgi:hypothetical protein
VNDPEDAPDPVVRNPPQRIFLAVGNIEEDCDFSELGEVSWAEEQIFDADIEYVLAQHSLTADELLKDAELSGYVEPSRRDGPPDPEVASKMSSHDIDICMARQGAEEWSEFADKAIAAVRRLEDLRRWRPMSELPPLVRIEGAGHTRWVLVRRKENHGYHENRYASCWFFEGSWRSMGGLLERHTDDCEWTYIPGQEPSDA